MKLVPQAAVALRLMLAAMALVSSAHATTTLSPWTDAGQPAALDVVMGASNPSIVLVRRTDADPLRTTDGGGHWAAFTVLGVRPERFVPSPVDPLRFYALDGAFLGDLLPSTDDPVALYTSSDGGITWRLVREKLEAGGGPLANLLAGPEPGVLYATRMMPGLCFINCIYEAVEVFRSRDDGLTWQSIDAGLDADYGARARALAASPSDPNVLYVATSRGIYRSSDQGNAWNAIRTWEDDVFVEQIVVDHRDANTLYVKADNGTLLWVTEDGGATWRDAQVHVPGPDRRVVADPAQAGRVYFLGSEGDVFESRDRARSWTRVGPASAKVGMASVYDFQDRVGRPAIGVADGTRVILNANEGQSGLKRIEIRPDALALGTDMWWNPSESGAGWSITQHESGQMFVVWYDYDSEGTQVWRAMPGGTWTDGRTFTGNLYSTRGPDYFHQPFNPAAVTVQPLGTATLRFDDSENAVFSYSVAGVTGEKRITRQLFGDPALDQFKPQNYADLWWNAQESGWGLAFSQQYSTAFATLFVYDAQGKPTWVVMPAGRLGWEQIGSNIVWNFFGDIYTTRGPRFGEAFDPAQVVVTKVGAASIAFDGRETAYLTYEAFGRNEKRRLTRQPF